MKIKLLTTCAFMVAMMAAAPVRAETTTTTTVIKKETPAAVTEGTITHKSGYIAYDLNRNGFLEPDEYTSYSYNVIDRDDDKFITDEEWTNYNTIWYGPMDREAYQVRKFGQLDKNLDGHVDFDEYTAVPEVNLFTGWDMDKNGYIDETEYQSIVTKYKTVDSNKIYLW